MAVIFTCKRKGMCNKICRICKKFNECSYCTNKTFCGNSGKSCKYNDAIINFKTQC